ncbi:MAG: protein hit, Hit-like protein involved in cell-cycle regulation [archaeon GW2011_AR19]|nr:MAG: protein hit, Hit-like protein involved in cell-cycle regulation [archaeon GW2011_AR19]
MTLPLEQTEQIKQQIIQQIENTFPEDKKESAIQQIEEMNESELENFLAQNNLIKTSENEEKQCIFCSIVSEKIPGYKISENDSALAVLEINPVSKGHTLIIPKVHVQEISKKTQDFAEEVSIKLKEKLNAKSIQTEDSEMFGHKIINIIPIYEGKTLDGKKQPASKKVLESLQKELSIKIEKKEEALEIEKKPEIISDKNTWLPRRIP